MLQLKGEEKGWDYWKRFNTNVWQYTKSGAAPAQHVGQGEAAVGVVFSHDIVAQMEKGLPIVLSFPIEGTGWEIGSMALLKGAKHANVAKTWFDWALEPTTQELGPKYTAYQAPTVQGARASNVLVVGVFVLTFVVWPLGRVIVQGYFTAEGQFSLEQFQRYVDPRYARYYGRIFYDTVRMGLLSASFGTALGLLFAYCTVYCQVPGKSLVHLLALLPTISPPFAIALAVILLFGRNGLVTRRLLADGVGVDVYGLGFDLFGMTGLVFVQTITYFSVAYLILRGMLERFNPALDEAAENLGASKFHVFGIMAVVAGRAFRTDEGVDMALGAG